MARYHGKAGRLYMSTTGSGDAEPVVSLSAWSIDQSADRVEVTAFGDNNRQYVQGFPDVSGTFSGWWDDTEDTIYDAQDSDDGVKIYLYPSTDAASKYWYGTAWVDYSVDTGATDGVSISGSFQAKGDWGRE